MVISAIKKNKEGKEDRERGGAGGAILSRVNNSFLDKANLRK